MKIRFHNQHLRFRLDELEIRQLCDGQQIASRISLELTSFSIELNKSSELNPVLILNEGVLQVSIPEDWTHNWLSDDMVGFEFKIESKGNQSITVVVEKDYPCAHTKEGKAIFGTPQLMPSRS